MIPSQPEAPSKWTVPQTFDGTGLAGTGLARCLKVFGRVLAYQRRAAAAEARNGGIVPVPVLRELLSGWAREALPLLNVEVQRRGPQQPLQTPAILVGNHLGYLDIPVLWSQAPVVLVGKAEIARWPILGAAGRRGGMVFVQRDSDGSRRQAAQAITQCLQSRAIGVGLFPSGTTSREETRPWRSGAFHIAQEAGVPVQPFRLSYDPPAVAAFVDRDLLLPHLLRLLRSGPILAAIEFGAPRRVEDPDALAAELWHWSRCAPVAGATAAGTRHPGVTLPTDHERTACLEEP